MAQMKLTAPMSPADALDSGAADRRRHRRHELAGGGQGVVVERRTTGDAYTPIGYVADLSAGGVRIVLAGDAGADIAPGDRVDVRLSLPDHAGLRPFVRLANSEPTDAEFSGEWTGSFKVCRRADLSESGIQLGGTFEGMADLDRGMLGLYLSVHPLAA